MKIALIVLLLLPFSALFAQSENNPTLKSILLEQLRTTHNVEDWFVPANIAIDGLTAEQANWKDGSDNHSIAQLTTHLIFWDAQQLAKFKGEPAVAFNGDNKQTFSDVNEADWQATVKRLDSVLNEWETAVQNASDDKLQKWYSTIAHIGTHNAYHIGQILYIRKMKGWWNPDKGVK